MKGNHESLQRLPENESLNYIKKRTSSSEREFKRKKTEANELEKYSQTYMDRKAILRNKLSTLLDETPPPIQDLLL